MHARVDEQMGIAPQDLTSTQGYQMKDTIALRLPWTFYRQLKGTVSIKPTSLLNEAKHSKNARNQIYMTLLSTLKSLILLIYR